MRLPLTGSQTVGPYFAIGLQPLCSDAVARPEPEEQIWIEGSLIDSNGVPIPDGFLEIWQADSDGRYVQHPPASFAPTAAGFGRISTSPNGHFRFSTVKPGPVPFDAEQMQAPHLVVLVYMRGLLRNLVTRMYFPDEPANAIDPVLQLVPEERRSTLIARAGAESGVLHWNVVMRDLADSQETVFFAW
jgi:protocatechuate 3,4-dioxygenase alpha subunit